MIDAIPAGILGVASFVFGLVAQRVLEGNMRLCQCALRKSGRNLLIEEMRKNNGADYLPEHFKEGQSLIVLFFLVIPRIG